MIFTSEEKIFFLTVASHSGLACNGYDTLSGQIDFAKN
jgi:hypothetical protein